MKIFDTHTHLNVEEFKGKEEAEIELARSFGVERMNVVGFDRPTIERAVYLADQYPEVYITLGWHPTEAGDYDQRVEDFLRERLSHQKVVALGEIGLDYHWMTAPPQVQKSVFQRQIALSKEFHLPIVVHSRDALEDTYQLIKRQGLGKRGGIFHSYSGSLEMAKRLIDLGMMISLSGVVTFKKAQEVQEVARSLPLEHLLVETDAPYLSPVPKRGKQNHSAYTRFVVEKIAELRGLPVEEVAAVTYVNANRIFGLEK